MSFFGDRWCIGFMLFGVGILGIEVWCLKFFFGFWNEIELLRIGWLCWIVIIWCEENVLLLWVCFML